MSDRKGQPHATGTTDSIPASPKRRKFLFSLSAGSAGAAAAAVAGTGAIAIVATQPTDADKSSGYRETEHVRDYYRTARI
jgi:hypothetical protein